MVAFPSVDYGLTAESIAEEMRPIVYSFFNAHIQIFDPKQMVVTPYNAITDEGGETEPELLFDSGANGARIQALGSESKADFAAQSINNRPYLFQTKLVAEFGFRSGLRLRVVDGGEDKSLEKYIFSVNAGLDGSYAWNRNIRATLDLTQKSII